MPSTSVSLSSGFSCYSDSFPNSKGGADTSQGKVNILLQGYISNTYIEDFALVSDTAYAAQVRPRVYSSVDLTDFQEWWSNSTCTSRDCDE